MLLNQIPNLISAPQSSSGSAAWTPPGSGVIKVNVDAALGGRNGGIAVGGVARDDSGRWIAGLTKFFPFSCPALEAEAVGLKEILS